MHAWLFEAVVQPVLFQAGGMAWAEQAYEWTELLLLGALEVAVLYALVRPLEALWPVEEQVDRRAVRVDVVYTLLSRLGILPILFFLVLRPAVDEVNAGLRMRGFIPPNLEDVWPVLGENLALSLLVYLLLFDLLDYWRHRFEHRFRFWWALHSVHHSQRQMTFWTDDREHLLDLLVAAALRAGLGLVLGVPPAQFLTLAIAASFVESLSHANVRLQFGWFGERLLVSPRFHRLHHAMELGHTGSRYGCNFAAVFPVWDILFGTANFSATVVPTGIADQLEGRDYGEGFFRQQWLGVRRMLGSR